jgi:alcohol dehydrogenase class IV
MALADTCAGIAICHAVVTLPHVIAHVIGGHFHDIAHGDALASIYSESIRFNSSALPEKHKFIANILEKGNDDVVSAFNKFIGQFEFERKLKKKYAEDRSISRRIAQDVFTYMKGVADLNPVSATEEDVENILEKSLA